MGTIVSRARKDGTFGHTAQIRLKSKGKVTHTESRTFDRKSAAQAWLKKRETELAEPGALEKPKDPLFKDVVDEYNATKQKEHGKTKTQVLNTIKTSCLGELRCSEIDSQAICRFIGSIDAKPATRGNYMSHLASVFTVVKCYRSSQLNNVSRQGQAPRFFSQNVEKIKTCGHWPRHSGMGVLAEQLGMGVIFFDVEARLPFGNARSMDSLSALLSTNSAFHQVNFKRENGRQTSLDLRS